MVDQMDRVATALADRHTIERELGSGGMDSEAEASARRFATRAERRRPRVVHDAPARRAAEPTLERRNTPTIP